MKSKIPHKIDHVLLVTITGDREVGKVIRTYDELEKFVKGEMDRCVRAARKEESYAAREVGADDMSEFYGFNEWWGGLHADAFRIKFHTIRNPKKLYVIRDRSVANLFWSCDDEWTPDLVDLPLTAVYTADERKNVTLPDGGAWETVASAARRTKTKLGDLNLWPNDKDPADSGAIARYLETESKYNHNYDLKNAWELWEEIAKDTFYDVSSETNVAAIMEHLEEEWADYNNYEIRDTVSSPHGSYRGCVEYIAEDNDTDEPGSVDAAFDACFEISFDSCGRPEDYRSELFSLP